MKGLLLVPLLLALSVSAAGCASDCDTTNSAGGQRVVCHGKTFSYTRNGSMVSEKEDYTWQNDATMASVSAAFNSSSGTATLTVKDANGKTVYSQSHAWNGQKADDQRSTPGEPGTWTISVNIGALTGQVAINVRPA